MEREVLKTFVQAACAMIKPVSPGGTHDVVTWDVGWSASDPLHVLQVYVDTMDRASSPKITFNVMRDVDPLQILGRLLSFAKDWQAVSTGG